MSDPYGPSVEVELNAAPHSGPLSRDARAGQFMFVADLEETPLLATDALTKESKPTSLYQDAWKKLRKNPIFIVSAVLILFILFVVAFPGVFTSAPPNSDCQLKNSLGPSQPGHIMGFDKQGCDIFSRVLHGARASVTVGVATTFFVVLIGGTLGSLAGFYGGWLDSVLSRITDIFFAVPLLLAAIVLMQMLPGSSVWTVVFVLAAFGWPQMTRITRGSVISVKNSDFITAATAVGLTRFKNLTRHVLPNALPPIIVTATVSLGVFIVAEATLSFLGIGLPPSVMSWGNDIATAQNSLRDKPSVLLWPSLALAITVLSFILLGDAIREALDPKAKKR
jgi:oligopeptide transport system permease protein